MKQRLFIGSSTESLAIAYAVQENLERSFEISVWTQGIFQPSQFTLESLLQALADFDLAIFVFAPNDVTVLRGETTNTVRDNVIFELGLFVGRLGRERAFLLQPRGTSGFHLPTDLLGLTPAMYEPDRQDGNLVAALGPACQKVLKAASSIGPKPIEVPVMSSPDETLDENDCVSLLESWMGSRATELNTQAIRFTDVDRDLHLPSGSTAKHIEAAAVKWGYRPSRRGNQTIVFQYP